jgi:peptidoglycan glycosyltransferase
MVSSPTYDPVDPPEISDDDSSYEGVYINRFLSSTYTPGSTYKLVTTAAAIENIEDLYDRTFTCTGTYEIGRDVVTCPGVHGSLTIEEALAVSCHLCLCANCIGAGRRYNQDYADHFG